jgi:quercetin dioxygenase-like cupin family protein
MEKPVKRVICGVDETGKSSILIDQPLVPIGVADELATADKPGQRMYLAWASDPVHSTVDVACSIQGVDLQLQPGETRFLRVEIGPGAHSAYHRTPHITDYHIALSGKLTMVAEGGTSSVLEPGDMLVQLGGWHHWHNEGDEPFVMAGVVVGVETHESVSGGVQFEQKEVRR